MEGGRTATNNNNNNNNFNPRDAANIHLRGDTLQIVILLPLRGRSPSLATVCSTYPIPSHPALLHKDSSLHGAPTVEDTYLCLKVRFPLAKHAIEQKHEPYKILSPPSLEVSYGRISNVPPGTASKGPLVARDLHMTRLSKECIKKRRFSEPWKS